jgi:plastocyanin
MPIRFYSLVVLAGAAALAVGCGSERSQPVSPTTLRSSGSTAEAGSGPLAAIGSAQHVVTMLDACDPETFNAALGPGTCRRSGGVRFADFLEQLGRHHSVGAWRFAPPNVTMSVGQLLVATNRGGEEHTFTEVEEFGGGIIADLNRLSGLNTVAPECTTLAQKDFIKPGASSSEEEDEAGVEKYQCCIHPWMRAEVRITAK